MSNLWFLFALVGATLLVVTSTVTRPIRRLFPSLLRCSQCTGFWIGALAGGFGLVSIGRGLVLDALVVGSAISFLAQLADGVLLNLLGETDEGE